MARHGDAQLLRQTSDLLDRRRAPLQTGRKPLGRSNSICKVSPNSWICIFAKAKRPGKSRFPAGARSRTTDPGPSLALGSAYEGPKSSQAACPTLAEHATPRRVGSVASEHRRQTQHHTHARAARPARRPPTKRKSTFRCQAITRRAPQISFGGEAVAK